MTGTFISPVRKPAPESQPVAASPRPTAPLVPREPGIYIGLPEDEYHPDPSLGSGAVRDLWFSPTDYWWDSPYNPNRPEGGDEDRPALVRGRAMHTLVLEGRGAFDRRYIRGAVHTADMTPPEKGAATKAANAAAAKVGKLALPSVDYDRLAIAGKMITAHPYLGTVLQGGIPEVSIFWRETMDGVEIPCKARIDWLKPRGCGDLKSITTFRKIEFRRACREAIANFRYDMQAAHYLRGRSLVGAFVEEGRVICHESVEPGMRDPYNAVLEQVAKEQRFAFQFIFFQAARSPIVWSTILSPANPIIECARRDRTDALITYATYMKKYGPNTPWLLADQPAELAPEEMPPWLGRK